MVIVNTIFVWNRKLFFVLDLQLQGLESSQCSRWRPRPSTWWLFWCGLVTLQESRKLLPTCCVSWFIVSTLSWRRSLSYRNRLNDLLCKSVDWFLYGRHLSHERIKGFDVGTFLCWHQFKYFNNTGCYIEQCSPSYRMYTAVLHSLNRFEVSSIRKTNKLQYTFSF